MKIVVALLFSILSFKALALGAKEVNQYAQGIMERLPSTSEVRAYQGAVIDEEYVDLNFILLEGEQEVRSEYTCSNECTPKSQGNALDIEIGVEAAFTKLNRTFRRLRLTLDDIKTLKVWKVIDTDTDHSIGSDIWTKVNYSLNGELKTTFVQCHKHSSDDQTYACHYKTVPENEPEFN